MPGERNGQEVSNNQVIIDSPSDVYLNWNGEDEDGREKGGLHWKSHQNPVVVSTACQEVFGGHFVPIPDPNEDSDEGREDKKRSEDEIIHPMKIIDLLHGAFSLGSAFCWPKLNSAL